MKYPIEMLSQWTHWNNATEGSDLNLYDNSISEALHSIFSNNPVLGVFDNVSKLIFKTVKENKVERSLVSTEGSLGSLDLLLKNQDVVLHILSFLSPPDLTNLFLVTRRMNFLASHDYVWRVIFQREKKKTSLELVRIMSWKEMYRKIHNWKWDTKCKWKSTSIVVSQDGTVASRNQSQGSNPAILTSHPLTRIKDSFEIEIRKRGDWIGIGIADRKFKVNNAATLGTQSHCVNSAFFCQDSTLIQMQGCQDKVNIENKLALGDRIKVRICFDTSTIYYYRNGTLEGELVSPVAFEEDKIFPTANLSFNSEVALIDSNV
eukprot:TRINITY_DN2595_c0_g1_i1.p1 TRINITY_DN2595_c0_g1~~TRINITY_DN2595_c0_g1_i1.p1  ORF type:complete len:319 (-),score=82.87 TRINITY_DN2595_c0_g1_i1:55-1011(-)